MLHIASVLFSSYGILEYIEIGIRFANIDFV